MITTMDTPVLDPADHSEHALRIQNITKHYGSVHALTDVTLMLNTGDVLGLVGENGAGKSTLIGVLSGSVHADSGSIACHGEQIGSGDARRLAAAGVSVVVQEQALVENLRVYENLFLNHLHLGGRRVGLIRKKGLRQLAEHMLAEIGLGSIEVNVRVGSLSFAERQLVEIAKAFVTAELSGSQPIILLDEPTSALSASDAAVLFDLIETWRDRAAIVYVSHILRDVRNLASRIVVLKDGQIVGDLDNVDITDERLHELMVGRERSQDYYHESDQQNVDGDNPAVRLRAASHDSEFSDIDLDVRAGEIVGLAGVVGSGASSVAAAVAGDLQLDNGSVLIGGIEQPNWTVRTAIRNGVLYVPPERSVDSIFQNASIRNNISIGFIGQLRSRLGVLNLKREREIVSGLAERTRVKAESIGTPASELSGGNQQKLVFARWLGRTQQVLVLNDPTRGIDVGTREELYGLIRGLAADGAAVLLCSESLDELIGLSNRVVVMRGGVVVARIPSHPGAKPSELDIVRHMI